MFRRASCCLVTISLTACALAQTVHTVGPGGFPQIQNAISAASPGDIVVVQSGSYLAFTLNKDLTLAAAPAATVDIVASSPLQSTVTVLQPPTMAKIAGLRFRTLPLFGISQVRVLGGTVHCADCVFEGAPTNMTVPPALVVQNAHLALQRCLVLGGGAQTTIAGGAGAGCDGMVVETATVAAVDSVFLGGNVHWDFMGHGGHAIVAQAAEVHLANCIAVGGGNDPIIPYHAPGNGIHVASSSHVWLADCLIVGGNGRTIAGGAAVRNLGATAVVEARSQLLGGPGAPVGPGVLGPLVTGPLLGLQGTTAAILLGATWTVGYRAAPGTPVLALASDRLVTSLPPLLAEPAWLPATSLLVAGAGVTDPAGALTFSFAIPPNPALLHAACFVQGLAGASQPLRAAPPVGGVVR